MFADTTAPPAKLPYPSKLMKIVLADFAFDSALLAIALATFPESSIH
jgi:hypothetical protein